ncbi:glycosyltransferase family 4 protein [Martelella mediterranea]|uniref:glycosyltransferase family 4 protein n=1 Tax=Martelella mediterranea TaxID=293089 RepID=UPI001E61D7BF|nr:glycosyltransferase family 4 protein [Martelella mediterranea]MCD1636363.1 glycosyltransferase family 4 protein [Martelella mediterranea]
MNILLLSRYSRLGASSRLRTMQYLPVLLREGFNVEVAPFFDDAYLDVLYSGQGTRSSTMDYMLQRFRKMRDRPKPDIIWLEKEALPWVPWLIESVILPPRVPIIVDYDDAIFHRYDKHRSVLVRTLLGRKIGKVMAASSLVVAGNSYLGDYARRSGAALVKTVPTVVDPDAYQVRLGSADESCLRVGWIGTPQTWKALANPVHKVIAPLLREQGALFRAVGAGMIGGTNGTLEILPWSEDIEVRLINSMNIGVMPLPDTPWTRGKCGYKLIQYMACGLPVVASPVGVNKDIVEHGVNGFLAETDEEWRSAIETLLLDADLRRRMGTAGRSKVEKHYSLQVWGPRLVQMFRSVADQGRRT